MKLEDLLNALPTKEDLLSSLPSKDDLANSMGYQKAAPATDMFAAFSIFGAGLLLGAGLALLFAPKSGTELRSDIANKMGEMNEHFSSRTADGETRYNAAASV